MTEEELKKIVEEQMLARRDEIVKVLMEFQRNPSARTFKDAENIPDILMGQAVDAIVGQVLGGVSEKVTIPAPAKKNSATRDGIPSQSN